MGTEKFIAFKEDGSAYRLKGRILRFLDNEPVSEADKTNIRSTLSVPASGEGLTPANNLSDLSNVATARTNLEVNSIDEDAQANALKTTAPALYFNGSSSYVQVADDAKLSFTDGTDDLPFSISVWLKFDDSVISRGIVTKYGGSSAVQEWALTTGSTGKLELYVKDTSGNSERTVSSDALTDYIGEWIHIAASYAGAGPSAASGNAFTSAADGIKLYINGSEITTTESSSGTYTGMSNTTQPIWIGRSFSSTFSFEGSIRDAKIFNKELTADEVAQLARGNDLGFSEEWGGAVGGIYASNFTSDSTDGWAVARATLDTTATVGGDSDNLKLVSDATASDTHYMVKSVSAGAGKRFRLSFDYYVPSGQTAVDSLAFYVVSTGTKYSIPSPTTDAWTRYEVESIQDSTGTALLLFYLNDGGADTFNGVSGEYVAFRNIAYTAIGTLADFRAEDYNESASKLLDRSSNNFVGVGTSVTLTGNQRHISADTIDLKNLPTSSAGLSAGEVWSNGGVLTVV